MDINLKIKFLGLLDNFFFQYVRKNLIYPLQLYVMISIKTIKYNIIRNTFVARYKSHDANLRIIA
jgi:hypothetical protein